MHLGQVHSRVKRPIGRRLALGLHALAYNGTALAQSPVIAGCYIAPGGTSMDLIFNASLLKGEGVTFDSNRTVGAEDTALYVLVNPRVNSSDPLLAEALSANRGHAGAVGSPDEGNASSYFGPFSNGNEYGFTGWVAVAASSRAHAGGAADHLLTIDLSHLPPGAQVSMIRYAAGAGGYEQDGSRASNTRVCCGPRVDVRYQPCAPESCPIKSTARARNSEQLPASPFLALVLGMPDGSRRCQCLAPQVCDAVGAR